MTGEALTSEQGAEAVFLANTARPEAQTSSAARELAEKAAATTVACADCGEGFLAGKLDISTGLCEICDEIAGIENEAQDGLISERAAEAKIARLRITQKAGI